MAGCAIRALLLDLSGVLYEGDAALTGAVAAVSQAREQGLVLRFVTNTATTDSHTIISKLRALGFALDEDELWTAPAAARAWLREQGLSPYCLVHPALHSEFPEPEPESPDAVLLGDARDGLNYASLNRAFRLCQSGAPLVGIGLNRYFSDDNGLSLDAGPFIKAIEWAAGIEAVIMGKPSAAFFKQIVASTGHPAAACMMVGDDREGDVIGAVEAGLKACLIRSGKYRPGDEQGLPVGAQVADTLQHLLHELEGSVS